MVLTAAIGIVLVRVELKSEAFSSFGSAYGMTEFVSYGLTLLWVPATDLGLAVACPSWTT